MSELTFNLDPAVAEAADKVRALARCSPAWYNWLSATLCACGVCLCECVGWGCVCVCSMYACRYVGDARMCVGGEGRRVLYLSIRQSSSLELRLHIFDEGQCLEVEETNELSGI